MSDRLATHSVSTLEVFLHEVLVGTITHVGNDRTLFALAQQYIENAERATLSLGLKDSFAQLVTDFKPTQTKLLPFLSNLLPEGEMRRYLAERANVSPEREFFLLWVLGQDLAGAITVKPADGEVLPPGIAEPAHEGEENQNAAMHFSLAGVQLKFSALQQAEAKLTIPVSGTGGSWIVKLPSSKFESVPENEFSMMELARKTGMDVPETRLLNVSDIENVPSGVGPFGKVFGHSRAFAIKRFDRTEDEGSVHVEDFAQVFGVYPHNKYKKASMRNIAEVIGIEGQEYDTAEFTRRLVFNTLIGNADMHLKNWSLIYRDKRTASIAPAYDFVSTIPYIADKEAALKVSRSKKFTDVTMDELSHLAAKARLPEKLVLDTAAETVSDFHEVWQKEKNNLALSSGVIEAIEQHLETLPMAKA